MNIFKLAGKGNLEELEKLISQGTDFEQKDEHGKTILCIAAHFFHLPLVKYLVSIGANIESKDKLGRTPLLFACMSGAVEVIEFLLKNGADINALNEDGDNGLMIACAEGNTETVNFLLNNGFNPNFIDPVYGYTPLMSCIDNAYHGLELVKLLIEFGADKNIKNKDSKTVLDLAIDKNATEIIAVLNQNK